MWKDSDLPPVIEVVLLTLVVMVLSFLAILFAEAVELGGVLVSGGTHIQSFIPSLPFNFTVSYTMIMLLYVYGFWDLTLDWGRLAPKSVIVRWFVLWQVGYIITYLGCEWLKTIVFG